MSTPSIRRVSYAQISGAANAPELIAEYAAECSIPDAEPQYMQYEAMEKAGVLQCFGAYLPIGHPLDDPILIGFASVLSAVMPHHGKRVATVETIFVSAQHRDSAAGNALLTAAERYAEELDCVAILYLARIGSPFEKVLLRRHRCVPTHTTYTRWL